MKILIFLALIGLAVFIGISGDEAGNSVAKYCTNLIAAAIFILAFWLPNKLDKKDE